MVFFTRNKLGQRNNAKNIELKQNLAVFFTRNKLGQRNNAKNIELKQNLAVFSYVKRKLLNQSEAKK
jgi:hypothetical protein